jgi:6,7-dimethyl-8-ribityllumazine synthase
MSEGSDPRIDGAEELRIAGAPPPGTAEPAPFGVAAPAPAPAAPAEDVPEAEDVQHAPGGLKIPAGVGVFAGAADGNRRSVGIVVSRFNGELTSKLLDGALEFLEKAGVDRARIDVMQVPGAFELPLGAMALARTRRYACVVALGVVIRGDTPHFDYVSAEAASGIQLAALETGIPVTLGVLTCDTRAQAEARAGGDKGNKGAEAARSALEMADVLGRLRSDAVVTAQPA